MKQQEKYIQRSIDLARNGLGSTYPNPLVGAVIVHNGKIIGEGWHRKAGEAHAEINAINSVKDKSLFKESEIYVSLEPCSHYGKTPPCALKIIELGFKKVIVGALDPSDKVNGKGIELMKNAGIEVVTGILGEKCKKLNKRFFTFHEKKRPYIFLKWAQSADGFIDKNFQPFPISNAWAKQFTHQMRAEEHSLLIGTKTALTDNPSLTTREVSGKNPIRILIDFDLKVPRNFNIFNNEAKTFIFNSIKNLEEKNLKFIKIERKNFLSQLMTELHENQIQSVIVEGGRQTLQSFIDENLWDEVFIIKNENLYLENGTPAPVFNYKHLKINTLNNKFIIFQHTNDN
ncbi:MAG: bifunctional diaminohydroxyphosphoribosylaminopyrimidine deaminase/5-amino-6-(5-phosphoribosylamino)uracil reductase RibD [Flavobacteriaceae bacterium]|nr:bifunctional diaminohydroxyphosphoribosylaminopyrimidine deaminase/5-amino-6-(5-phosphoribosylamino)uracil reductase RibD [Flavobacteriaceae bacterium]